MGTLSTLLTTQGTFCSFEPLVARIRYLHDSKEQWASNRVVVDHAILKSNLSFKATMRSSSINSFFLVNNLPTPISVELQLLTKSRVIKFEGKIRARLIRGLTVILLLKRAIGGIGQLSLLLIRIS